MQEVLKLRLATSKTSVKNMKRLTVLCAQKIVFMDCYSFMEQTGQADGQEDWCRFIIFRRIIYQIWNWREHWCQKEDMKKWNFSMRALECTVGTNQDCFCGKAGMQIYYQRLFCD